MLDGFVGDAVVGAVAVILSLAFLAVMLHRGDDAILGMFGGRHGR